MSVGKLIANLLWLAYDDLDDARRLSAAGKRNAAYHLEQAAEKALKAVLISESIAPGAGHQLDQLASQLPDENPYKSRLKLLDELTVFATTYRYVTGSGRIPRPMPVNELHEWISELDRLIVELAVRFGADLSTKDAAAKSPAPLRGPVQPD